VVDDDDDMRSYVHGCLRATGLADVVEAADAEGALALARSLALALVVSDLVMPGLDGEALCRALKTDPSTATVPVLLVSGAMPLPRSCADGFLAKPFNAAGLHAAVAPLLAQLA